MSGGKLLTHAKKLVGGILVGIKWAGVLRIEIGGK